MREVIVREKSKAKEAVKVFGSKAEDIFLNLVRLLPEQLIPETFMERYLQKRKAELEAEQIKNAWRKNDLEIAQQVICKK